MAEELSAFSPILLMATIGVFAAMGIFLLFLYA